MAQDFILRHIIFCTRACLRVFNRVPIHSYLGKWNIPLKKFNIKTSDDIHHKPFGA
jgi:hypothetical protein